VLGHAAQQFLRYQVPSLDVPVQILERLAHRHVAAVQHHVQTVEVEFLQDVLVFVQRSRPTHLTAP
jgi:hypothetical protein